MPIPSAFCYFFEQILVVVSPSIWVVASFYLPLDWVFSSELAVGCWAFSGFSVNLAGFYSVSLQVAECWSASLVLSCCLDLDPDYYSAMLKFYFD